jgi:hypothetical protein
VAVEATFAVTAAEVGDQVVGGHEVSAISGLDGGFGQGQCKVTFSCVGRTHQDDV